MGSSEEVLERLRSACRRDLGDFMVFTVTPLTAVARSIGFGNSTTRPSAAPSARTPADNGSSSTSGCSDPCATTGSSHSTRVRCATAGWSSTAAARTTSWLRRQLELMLGRRPRQLARASPAWSSMYSRTDRPGRWSSCAIAGSSVAPRPNRSRKCSRVCTRMAPPGSPRRHRCRAYPGTDAGW